MVVAAVGIALLGGSMAATAGARRSATALDRFRAFSRADDAYVTPGAADIAAIDRLPQVEAAAYETYLGMVPAGADGRVDPADAGSINVYLRTPVVGPHDAIGRRRVIAGRDYNPSKATEAVIDEELAATRHLRPGSRLRMVAFSPAQIPDLFSGPEVPAPEGPTVDLTITGIVRLPVDLGAPAGPEEITYGSQMDLYVSPALYAARGAEIAAFGPPVVGEAQAILLRRGARDLAAFEAAVAALPGGAEALVQHGGSDADSVARDVRRAIAVETASLYALAVALALAGAALVGQGLARLARATSPELGSLRVFGAAPVTLALAAATPGAVVVLLIVALCPIVAVAASPLTPIGLARGAEVAPGAHVDATVVALGAAALAVVGLAAAGLTALPTVRRLRAVGGSGRERASRLARWMAAPGVPLSASMGARFALEPSIRRRAPLRYAAGVGGLAFAVLAGVVSYGASLDRLVADRALQGATWDIRLGNPNVSQFTPEDEDRLLATPGVAGASAVTSVEARGSVDGADTAIAGLERLAGAAGPRVVTGRLPSAPREVALGLRTAREVGARVGDEVQVSLDGVEVPMTVVGTAVLNPELSFTMDIGAGAIVTIDQLQAMSPQSAVNGMLVWVAQGASITDTIATLSRDFPNVARPAPAAEVRNLDRVRRMPGVLAQALVAAALSLLAVALFASARERRRELGILRALGATRHQITAALLWQGVWVYAGALVGLPVGVVVGRSVWMQVTEHLGTLAGPLVPYAFLGASALVGLGCALILALGPALEASRAPAANSLRAD